MTSSCARHRTYERQPVSENYSFICLLAHWMDGDTEGVRYLRQGEAHPYGDWWRSPRGW